MDKDIKYFASTSFRRGYSIDIIVSPDFNTNEAIAYTQSYLSIVLLHKNSKNIRINFNKISTTENILIVRPEDIVSHEEQGILDFTEMCLDTTFLDILTEKEEFKASYPFIFNKWQTNSWHIDETMFDILEEKMLLIKSMLETGKGAKDKYLVFAIFIECITLLNKSIEEISTNGEQGETENSRTLSLINKFHVLIDKYFRTEASVAFYADKLCVTPDNLCRTIKAATGNTPKQIITSRKMHEAQRMLTYSDKEIRDIAASLGYPDMKEFCRVFKKQIGCLPTDYKYKTR